MLTSIKDKFDSTIWENPFLGANEFMDLCLYFIWNENSPKYYVWSCLLF